MEKIITISKNSFKYLSDVLRTFFRGELNILLAVGMILGYVNRFIKIGIYPRRVTMPNGTSFFTNNASTISINAFDHYVKKEYSQHPDFIPKKSWLVLDVGACIGLYTIYASKLVGDQGCVIAFEPNPYSYYWLKKNIILNKLSNVQVFPIALADYDGFSDFYCLIEGNIGESSLLSKHILRSGRNYILIKVLTKRLDSLLEKNRNVLSKYDQVDLVKIDVEGAELRVLKGSDKFLQKQSILRFIIECHLNLTSFPSIMDFLKTYGYTIERVVTFSKVKKIIYAKATR